jgi:hypothetical protein
MKHLSQICLIFLISIAFAVKANAQCPLDCRYLYVDGAVASSGVGDTWATAFKTVQEALTAANTMSPADTIIIKAGTYKPDNGTDRAKSFVIDKEVYMYGGYNGTELESTVGGLLPLSDYENNVTELSGDIGTVGVNIDNSYHVVKIIAPTIKGKMYGLSIIKGNANGANPDNNGGGIWVETNTTYNMEQVRVADNLASSNGGGIYVSTGAKLNMSFMTGAYYVAGRSGIENNTAGFFGGGVFYEVGAKLEASIIYVGNNTAQSGGGGVYISGGAVMDGVWADFTFYRNRVPAGVGGGLLIAGDIVNTNMLIEMTFKENESLSSGGGLYVANTTTNLILGNIIFLRNQSNSGGGITVFNSNNLQLWHMTLKDNIANNASSGGGVFINNNGVDQNLNISNCLFWGNTANAAPNSTNITNLGPMTLLPVVQNCLFQDASCPTNFNCNGTCIYNQDPQFLPGYPIYEEVMLVPASPAAEAGILLSPRLENDRFAYVRSCIADIGAVEVQRLWTGGVGNTSTSAGNGNWNVPQNWTPQSLLPMITYSIPTGTYTAMIQSGAVTIDANQSAHAIYLEGGSLTMSNNATLSIKRIFRKSNGITFYGGGGNFISGDGTETVVFENDCNAMPYNLTQRDASVIGRLTFNYLRVNNAPNLFAFSPETIAVKRLLTLQDGNFKTNNNLALLSNASYSAMLINNAFEIQGTNAMNTNRNVIVQRYVTPSPRPAGLGYTYFSSPVQGATVSTFAPFMNLVLDNGGNPYYWFNLFYTAANFPTFFKYVEGNNNIFEGGAPPQAGWRCPAPGEVLQTGVGYIANLNGGVTVNFYGYLNNGNISVPVTRGSAGESGWNLVGNPYPSPIDWTTVYNLTGNNTIVSPFIWRRIATGQYTGTFDYYQQGTPAGTNGGTTQIQSSQGFFVRATTNGNLTMNNTMRVTSGYANPQFFRTEESKTELEGFLRLELKNSRIGDGTIINFNSKATEKIDANFDMEKIMLNSSNVPNFYTRNENKRIAINGLPPLAEERIIPLFFITFESGQHTISASHIANFKENVMVILEDKTLGILHDLQAKPYVFTTNANNGAENNRFQLRLMPNMSFNIDEWASINIFPNPTQNDLQIKLLSKQEGNLKVNIYDATGRMVLSDEIEKTRDIMEGKYNISDFKQGIYIVELQQGNNKMTKKILKQ